MLNLAMMNLLVIQLEEQLFSIMTLHGTMDLLAPVGILIQFSLLELLQLQF